MTVSLKEDALVLVTDDDGGLPSGDDYAYAVAVGESGTLLTTRDPRTLTSRIVNLSVRSAVSVPSPELTVGFVVSGVNKPLLIRAVGPTLAQFGVDPALARPGLGVYAGETLLVRRQRPPRLPLIDSNDPQRPVDFSLQVGDGLPRLAGSVGISGLANRKP